MHQTITTQDDVRSRQFILGDVQNFELPDVIARFSVVAFPALSRLPGDVTLIFPGYLVIVSMCLTASRDWLERKAMVKESTVQRVVLVFEEVLKNKNMRPPTLDAGTILDGSLGLESLDFAEIVVRLADEFENDPFASAVTPEVTTLGDLAALY